MSAKKLEDYQSMKMSSAGASMWLNKRYNSTHNISEKPVVEAPKVPMFAPKIVRQCSKCQMLYSTFHACQEDKGEESTWSQK